jgi:hypothetical protein
MTDIKHNEIAKKDNKPFKHWSISLRDHYIMHAPPCPDWYMEHERNQEVRHCSWPVWWADRLLAERKSRYHFDSVDEVN